jgi:acyl dehydratase
MMNAAPSAMLMYWRALRTAGKSPAAVEALPQLTYVRPDLVLDAGHIARYEALCGFAPAQGLPLTYPQLLTFPLVMQFIGSKDCPWPAMGTVHLANAMEQFGVLNAGDRVRVEMSTGLLFTHEKGQAYTLDFRILRDGQALWQGTQTLLRVGVKQARGEPYASQLSGDLPLSHQADLAVPGNIGRRYGRISGDMNPIHLSALSARLFGFRRAIAHGLWTQARALAALLPPLPVSQAAVAVDFKTPLFLPARASLWTSRSAGGASFEVRDAKGQKPHLRGELRC